MSSASGAASPPATLQADVASPGALTPVAKPPSGNKLPYVLAGVLAVAGLVFGIWRYQTAHQAAQTKAAAVSAIRTTTVARGDVVQTLRLTGTTGAEKFASLLVPQLRGSRSDALRTGKAFDSPGANYQIQSNAGAKSSGGGSSTPTGSGGSGGSASTDGNVASTMGQSSTGTSSALKSATSRVGNNSRTTLGTMQPASPTTDINNVGSTTQQLAGTGTGSPGGGGGGQSDYMLVLQRAAKPGSMVKKGSEVAEFDRVNALTRLDDYRASVAQMDASFVKLKAEIEAQKRARKQTLDNAKAALDQAQLDLKTIPVLGAIEAERVRLAAEEAQAHYKELVVEQKFSDASYESQVKVSELELQQAHLELKRAERNADLLLMKAPINGLVVMQTMFRGGSELVQIQAGDQLYSGMRFMQIVDPSKMVVNATLNQVDADLVRVGSKATVHFDAFPDLQLPATVEAIGAMTRPGMMRAAYVKEIPVMLRMDKLDPRVIPDLSVSVDVEISSEKQVAIAPLASIFPDEARPHVSWVYVRKGDAWEKRQVETGRADNLTIAVRSGLQPGEVVALERPPDSMPPGAAKDQS